MISSGMVIYLDIYKNIPNRGALNIVIEPSSINQYCNVFLFCAKFKLNQYYFYYFVNNKVFKKIKVYLKYNTFNSIHATCSEF